MLCSLCISMFEGASAKGLHHKCYDDLKKAAALGCRVCLYLVDEWPGQAEREALPRMMYMIYRTEMNFGRYSGRGYILFQSFAGIGDVWRLSEPIVYFHISDVQEMPEWHWNRLQEAEADLRWRPWRVPKPWNVRRDVVQHAIPDNTAHESVHALAKKWMEECCRSHDCGALHRDRDPLWRPKRLILVGDSDHPPKLVLPELSKGSNRSYATLSHCWGSNPTFVKLTTENLKNFQTEIPFDELPRNFQDSIITCRRLNIDYLWIDSLCILQSGAGSEEDWEQHMQQMREVYLNCELNIAITHAQNAEKGAFVERNPNFLQNCQVFTTYGRRERWRWCHRRARMGAVYTVYFDEFDTAISRDQSPLHERGWVLQEQLFSPRVLYFCSDRIAWSCNQTSYRSEYLSYAQSLLAQSMKLGPQTPLATDIPFNIIDNNKDEEDAAVYLLPCWHIIRNYSSRLLTYPNKDKLPAFAGIAKHIAESRPGNNYFAGLFREDFLYGLLWQARQPLKARRPIAYRAPSWSWTSLDGEIEFPTGFDFDFLSNADISDMVMVESVEIEPANTSNPYGPVKSGLVRLSGASGFQITEDFGEKAEFNGGRGQINYPGMIHIIADSALQTLSLREEGLFLLPLITCNGSNFGMIASKWNSERGGFEAIPDTDVGRDRKTFGLLLKRLANGFYERRGVFKAYSGTLYKGFDNGVEDEVVIV